MVRGDWLEAERSTGTVPDRVNLRRLLLLPEEMRELYDVLRGYYESETWGYCLVEAL